MTYTLANWPPSRGPMPKWMATKPKYNIPALKIELVSKPLKVPAQGALRLSLNHRVSPLANLKPEQWDLISGVSKGKLEAWLANDKPVTIDLSYPLNKIARVTVRPYSITRYTSTGKKSTHGPLMSVGYVLWSLAQAYKRIYKAHVRYGVWGHDIGDLAFEGLTVNGTNGAVDIGS